MNDILDTLMGDGAEAGREKCGILVREDSSWLVDGDYPYYEFLHFFDLTSDIEPQIFDTLVGSILSRLGYIPKVAEKLVWSELKMPWTG